jgi:hypothetical protein
MLSARRIRWLQVCCVFFFFCLLIYELCSGLSHAQVPPQSPLEGKSALVLHAFESNLPVFELADRGLKASLDTDGVGIRNQKYEDEARRSLRKWEGQLEFRYLSDIPLQKILDTVSTAAPGIIIRLMGFPADGVLRGSKNFL